MNYPKTRTVIFFNTVSQVLGRAVSSITTFVISLLLARNLGALGYGDFSKVTTYIAFFYLVADLGLNAAFLQKQQEDEQLTFQHLLGLRLAISILAGFVAVGLLAFLPQGQGQGYTTLVRLGIVLYTGSIITQGLITSANAMFQRQLEYKRATLAVIIGSLVTLGLIILFGSATVLGTLIIFLAGSAITAGLSLWLCRPFVTTLSPRFSSQYWGALLIAALPLSLTLIFNLIYFRIDSVVMTLTQSTIHVGIYNFAYKIFELPLVFPTFFMNALFPIFLKEHGTDKHNFWRHITQSAVLLGVGSFATTVLLWFAAPYIGTIAPSFTEAATPVRILALGLPFFFLSALTMWILITLKKRFLLVTIYGGSMIFNVIADVLFIPTHGYIAASWITVIGELLVLLISAAVVLTERKAVLKNLLPRE